MNTYNLITIRDGQAAAVEPLISDSADKAIAYAAGMLSERVKGREEMFTSLGVRWFVDCGDRDILDMAMPVGDQLGAFRLVQAQDRLNLLWLPEVRA